MPDPMFPPLSARPGYYDDPRDQWVAEQTGTLVDPRQTYDWRRMGPLDKWLMRGTLVFCIAVGVISLTVQVALRDAIEDMRARAITAEWVR